MLQWFYSHNWLQAQGFSNTVKLLIVISVSESRIKWFFN